jgi:hypothetical protein
VLTTKVTKCGQLVLLLGLIHGGYKGAAIGPHWHAVQIRRSKWSNVIRHPSFATSILEPDKI